MVGVRSGKEAISSCRASSWGPAAPAPPLACVACLSASLRLPLSWSSRRELLETCWEAFSDRW